MEPTKGFFKEDLTRIVTSGIGSPLDSEETVHGILVSVNRF